MAPPRPSRRAPDDPLLARSQPLPGENVAGRPLPPPTGRSTPARPRGPNRVPAVVTSSLPSERSGRPKRRHPARTARLAALVISCASTAGLAYLFADINATTSAANQIAALPAPIATLPATSAGPPEPTPATTSSAAAPPPAGTAGAAPITSPTTQPTASATVEAFDGQVIGTEYGPVQIQAQMRLGKLADVAVIESPNAERKSVRINAQALPALRTEALTAQSARIDTVSGATYTSDAYRQSLQSALDAARAAGATTTA